MGFLVSHEPFSKRCDKIAAVYRQNTERCNNFSDSHKKKTKTFEIKYGNKENQRLSHFRVRG